MADIKISELTAKGSSIASTDLLEISENTADGYVSKSVTGANIVASAQNGMQPTLVSGTNIKTINSNSILGSGNISLTKSDIGLSNVDNTSDVNKPISTATQTALNGKQNTLISSTNIKTINGNSLLGSGDLTILISNVPKIVAKKSMVLNLGLGTNVLIASEDISASVTSNAMLQIIASYRKTVGGSSSVFQRLYVNNSATLTGATLIGTFTSVTLLNNMVDAMMNVYTDGTSLYVQSPTTVAATRYGSYAGSVITIPSPCYLIWALQTPNGDAVVMLNSTITLYA
jgi:hypothetical protein